MSQGTTSIAEEQLPLAESDTYSDPESPFFSDVTAETDFTGCKPFTDVIVLCRAMAPAGKKAYHIDCVACVGPLKKEVRVFGNRRLEAKAFRGIALSDPEPFEERDIGYRFAYGGTARDKNGAAFTYHPNPIGKGFCFKASFDDPSQIAPPNQEDPQAPLSPEAIVLSSPDDWAHGPRPASFGWTRRNFFPRYTYAGVLPEFLAQAQLSSRKAGQSAQPSIPAVDFRFYQGASDGLWGERLKGTEHVRLEYMDKKHSVFQFDLPGDRPVMTLDIGDGPAELFPELETVVIDKVNNLMAMTWRGSKGYGGVESLAGLPILKYEAVDNKKS